MIKWQHARMTCALDELEGALRNAGNDGWELAAMHKDRPSTKSVGLYELIFKRPLAELPPASPAE